MGSGAAHGGGEPPSVPLAGLAMASSGSGAAHGWMEPPIANPRRDAGAKAYYNLLGYLLICATRSTLKGHTSPACRRNWLIQLAGSLTMLYR